MRTAHGLATKAAAAALALVALTRLHQAAADVLRAHAAVLRGERDVEQCLRDALADLAEADRISALALAPEAPWAPGPLTIVEQFERLPTDDGRWI